MKKKAFGIVLLVLAALILLQGNFGIPSFGGQVLLRDRNYFLLSDPQGGSRVTALPIPPKRKSKKHEVRT